MPPLHRLSRFLPGYRAGRREVLTDLRFLVDTAPTGEAHRVLTAAHTRLSSTR